MMLPDSAAEELQYPGDLRLLVKFKLSQLVIEGDHRLRLHEKSGSRRGLVVHHSREQTYVFPLDRDHVPSVAHRHYGILKVGLRRGRAHHLLQA